MPNEPGEAQASHDNHQELQKTSAIPCKVGVHGAPFSMAYKLITGVTTPKYRGYLPPFITTVKEPILWNQDTLGSAPMKGKVLPIPVPKHQPSIEPRNRLVACTCLLDREDRAPGLVNGCFVVSGSPEGNIEVVYKWYILRKKWGVICHRSHLLREPKTTIWTWIRD